MCLGTLLANVIMTELESSIADNLFKDNLLTFYEILYSWHTSINTGLAKLNSFDSSLKFTVDKFDDGVAQYLDIKIKDSDINTVLNKLNSFHPSLKFSTDKFDNGVVHYLEIKIIKPQFIIKTLIQININRLKVAEAFFFHCTYRKHRQGFLTDPKSKIHRFYLIWGKVSSRKWLVGQCLVGEMVRWGTLKLVKRPVGEMSVWEISVGELSGNLLFFILKNPFPFLFFSLQQLGFYHQLEKFYYTWCHQAGW